LSVEGNDNSRLCSDVQSKMAAAQALRRFIPQITPLRLSPDQTPIAWDRTPD